MKTKIAIFWAVVLTGQLVAVAADEEFAAFAGEKRAAMIKLWDKSGMVGFGAFISEDGLAIVGAGSIAFDELPEITTADGTELRMGTILEIFPEQERALIQFKYRPSTWLRVAAEEPEVGESVALVPVNVEDLLDDSVPPVVGRIMVKRTGTTANTRLTRFVRVFSLGSNPTREQLSWIGHDSCAINRKGELVGFAGQEPL